MSPRAHDPLLERLRAADPTAGEIVPAGVDHDRVDASRRARTARHRRRMSGSGALFGLLVTLALAFVPASDRPSNSSIFVAAVQAAKLPSNSIVAIDTTVTLLSKKSGYKVRRLSWLRTSARGKVLEWRSLVLSASDPAMLRDTSFGHTRSGIPVTYTYNPRTGRQSRSLNTRPYVNSLFSQIMHSSLEAVLRSYAEVARSNDLDVTATGPMTIEGRRAYTIDLTGSAPSRGERRELSIDAKSFKPFLMRRSIRGKDEHGNKYVYRERILSQQVLADTPHNRRFLRVRGPLR